MSSCCQIDIWFSSCTPFFPDAAGSLIPCLITSCFPTSAPVSDLGYRVGRQAACLPNDKGAILDQTAEPCYKPLDRVGTKQDVNQQDKLAL
jgi:hypothetical protein